MTAKIAFLLSVVRQDGFQCTVCLLAVLKEKGLQAFVFQVNERCYQFNYSLLGGIRKFVIELKEMTPGSPAPTSTPSTGCPVLLSCG